MPRPEPYVTKDASLVRELVHPAFVPGAGMSLAQAEVAAGSATEWSLHTTFDEICYCLEGAGVLHVNDKTFPFFPGACHYLPKGSWHHLVATTTLKLLCVCCPAYSHEETVLAGDPPL